MPAGHLPIMHSSYYPPRSRHGRRVILPAWFEWKRLLRLERLRPHWLKPVSFTQSCLSLLVPGAAYWVCGWRWIGRALLAGYLLAALVFLAAYGYPAGNAAFGLMLSAHGTSIAFFLTRWVESPGWKLRLAAAVTGLLAAGVWLYFPLRAQLLEYVLPLRINDRVIVVNRLASPASIRRGDWIAYTIAGQSGHGYYLREGASLERVLGLAGDQLRFREDGCEVNGAHFPARAHMPVKGEALVPEKHWFIWPTLTIRNPNGRIDVEPIVMQAAMVAEEQYLGRPFRHWFGRSQALP